jgi:nitrite reductase/ring-hydroxylating ferredoxin subunit
VVASSDDVVEGGRVVVDLEGVEVGVFRLDGALHAWGNVCPHVGGPVCQGVTMSRVVERLDEQRRSVGDFFGDETHIVCPWHGYEFDLRTGRHPADPGIRLRRYPVHERDGEIVVEF